MVNLAYNKKVGPTQTFEFFKKKKIRFLKKKIQNIENFFSKKIENLNWVTKGLYAHWSPVRPRNRKISFFL